MEIDLKELKEDMDRNNIERKKFIDFWIDFMNKNPNAVWSSQHTKFINSVYQKAPQTRQD